jgi:hypothetical protein
LITRQKITNNISSYENPYIEEEQRTRHTYTTKVRVTRTSLETGGELSCSGRVSSSCSTSGTCRVNLVTNPVTSREWGKDREIITTSGTYQYFQKQSITYSIPACSLNLSPYVPQSGICVHVFSSCILVSKIPIIWCKTTILKSSCSHFNMTCLDKLDYIIRVWRYQRGNQNPYIEEEQKTQWPKEKVQKDKQRSTKHTHKTKDRVIRTPLKIGSSCSTSGTHRVTFATSTVINHEWGKDQIMTNGTCFVDRFLSFCPFFF